jgi:indole-3-glycerol phosphate synthase
MGVLSELVAGAHRRVEDLDRIPRSVKEPSRSFVEAIAGKDHMSVVAEFKRCSPSLGRISAAADLTRKVMSYIDGGASAISVLTEPTRFLGSYDDLRLTAATVEAPVLMKDFLVSPRQVELAVSLGASAVLLIVRCLESSKLAEMVAACRESRLTPLIECHDAAEIETALGFEDAVIGVNHRDLSTFAVDVERGRGLMQEIPSDRVVVSESGMETPAQVRGLVGLVDAVLVGTALMRATSPQEFLREALS